jgi:Tfp pilus assembly protein PilW
MDWTVDNAATKGFAAGEADGGWKVPAVSSASDSLLAKPFDIEPGATAGKIKLVRCYFQMADAFYQANDTAEITPAAGNLCAVINTNDGTVTAVMNATFNPATPELFPLRLYVLDADGNVTCDCRGSQVVVYG